MLMLVQCRLAMFAEEVQLGRIIHACSYSHDRDACCMSRCFTLSIDEEAVGCQTE